MLGKTKFFFGLMVKYAIVQKKSKISKHFCTTGVAK